MPASPPDVTKAEKILLPVTALLATKIELRFKKTEKAEGPKVRRLLLKMLSVLWQLKHQRKFKLVCLLSGLEEQTKSVALYSSVRCFLSLRGDSVVKAVGSLRHGVQVPGRILLPIL